MCRIVLTRDVAQRAGWDAANRSMRSAGRKAWNEEDYDIAVQELNRLWPLCRHHYEPGECPECHPAAALK